MVRRRIRLDDIPHGAALPCDLYSATGAVVLRINTVLRNDAEWRQLVDTGLFMDLRLQRRLEPPSVRACLAQSISLLDQVYAAPEPGAGVAGAVNRVVSLINAGWARSKDVMIACVMLAREPTTPARHAIHTACFVQAVMHSMGLDDRLRQAVLAAALTLHLPELAAAPDDGSMVARIADHAGNLPTRLQALGIQDANWLAVLEYATLAMRTEYRQRTTDTLVIAGQLVALADLYCERIARPEDEYAGNSRSVLRDLLIERGQHFDALLASHFIRALGVYPVGSVVLLRSGEIGVVCNQSDQIDAPWVCSLIAPLGTPIDPPKLCDTREPADNIRASLGPTDLLGEVDLDAIWGEAAREFCFTCLDASEVVENE
ncbi:MAG: hypothetical protein JO218_13060 [Burkholderiales bacterium]|nr:hypothetical protein [Burkholderiales bacterium]